MTRARRLGLYALLLLGAPACSNAPGAPGGGAYRRGVEALAQGQPRTARIELLNAIKADPNDPKARIAQARAYLLLGDGVAAEAEIVRARALGVPQAETSHLLAHALLLEKQPQQAIDEAAKASPAHAAYAARIRGDAWLALDDPGKAAQAFNQALAATPEDPALWTDIARFRRATGELAGAIAAADKAVALNPDHVEALSLRGELTRGQYGLAAAIPWFDRALEVDPTHAVTLAERAATLAELGRMKDMLADTRKLLSVSPGNPTAYYLQAMLAARAGKFDLARSLYERSGGAYDDKPAGMLLASAIDYGLGRDEQAIQRLGLLLAAQPDNAKARRLLGAAQWRMHDAEATIATLRPLADRPDADSYELTLIGKAWQALGNSAAASAYLARAVAPQRRSATALLGYPPSGEELDALRRAAAFHPRDAGAQVQLIRALLAKGLGAEALHRARALHAGNPGAPDAYVLVGDALGIQGNFAAAAAEYRKAANIAFTEPVAMRLIEALRNSGDRAGAASVLQLYLGQNPQSVPALLLAANSFLEAGEWRQAIPLYERLRQRIGDRDATLLNNLAWAYGETGDYEQAVPLARKAWSLDRRNPATADTLGWLLLKSGADRARGLALLEQAASGAPSDAQIRAHLQSARRG